jgi:hypothetical protein
MPDYPVKYTESTSIEHHVALINEMTHKSVRDPELRQLAVKIVSGSYVWRRNPRTGKEEPYLKAWDMFFLAPGTDQCAPRDGECELLKIWNFVVLNFRYVYDPADVDTFATAKKSLEAGGGDCDDATILFCALLKAIGFECQARVISVSSDPENWVHIYPMVGLPKDEPTQWWALDMTVEGYQPGDEFPDIGKILDTPV